MLRVELDLLDQPSLQNQMHCVMTLTETWECDISFINSTSPRTTSAHTGSAPCWGAVGGTCSAHSWGKVNVFILPADCMNEVQFIISWVIVYSQMPSRTHWWQNWMHYLQVRQSTYAISSSLEKTHWAQLSIQRIIPQYNPLLIQTGIWHYYPGLY